MARDILPVSKLRARRKRRALLLLGATLLGIVLLCGFIVWFTWRPFWRIATIDIAGAQTVAVEDIRRSARVVLAQRQWLVFPGDNILTYPKERLAADLREAYPVFESVEIHAQTFTGISIAVKEQSPHALWCADADSAKCFLMNDSGVIYGPAPEFSGDAYVRFYGRTARPQGELPNQYLSASEFRTVAALADAFAQKAGTAVSVTVDDNNDARVRFDNGFEIWFAAGDDGGKISERFAIALRNPPFTTHAIPQLEYLDLRFGDKLYYKLR